MGTLFMDASLREGMSVQDAAQKYKRTPEHIWLISRKQGVRRSEQAAQARQVRNIAVAQDLREGMSVKEAATRYGLSESCIYRISRKQGVVHKRRARPTISTPADPF